MDEPKGQAFLVSFQYTSRFMNDLSCCIYVDSIFQNHSKI